MINNDDASVTVNMDEDTFPTPFSLTLSATDPDPMPWDFSWSIRNQMGDGPADGMAAIAGDGVGASEAISYTPVLNFNGIDSFVVQILDNVGLGTDTIVVNVNVAARNDPPEITAVGTRNGTEGQVLVIAPVVEDPDTDNDGIGHIEEEPGPEHARERHDRRLQRMGVEGRRELRIEDPVAVVSDEGP